MARDPGLFPDRFGDIHEFKFGLLRPPPEVTLTIDGYSFGPGMDFVRKELRGASLDFILGLGDGRTKIENALRIAYGGPRRRRTWMLFKLQTDRTIGGNQTIGIVGHQIGDTTMYMKYQKKKPEAPSESEVRLRMSP